MTQVVLQFATIAGISARGIVVVHVCKLAQWFAEFGTNNAGRQDSLRMTPIGLLQLLIVGLHQDLQPRGFQKMGGASVVLTLWWSLFDTLNVAACDSFALAVSSATVTSPPARQQRKHETPKC
jgi:hypothetical protein